ncbi:MAG TPA: hypothetical protein VGL86_33835 [Polyangia bacterium]
MSACAARQPHVATAARAPTPTIRAAGDGLYFVDVPGTHGKGIVVEQGRSLCLIDPPLSDVGGEATALHDDVDGGRRLLAALDARFPQQRLAYLLSSHWHPHSLAALRPFLDRGVRVVTTRANFARLREMLLPNPPTKIDELITFVDEASLAIGEGSDRIIAHRLLKKDFPSTPTDDYLFFELPRYDALYAACMFFTWPGPLVAGRPFVTEREEDLFRFLQTRALHPRWLIRLEREASGNELVPFGELAARIDNGVHSVELTRRYRAASTEELRRDRATLAAEAIADHVPAYLLNDVVYESVAAHELDRALELATLQVLIAPSSSNAWDTLGEVAFVIGTLDAARAYEAEARRRAKGAYTGGESVWRSDLEQYRRDWAAHRRPGP